MSKSNDLFYLQQALSLAQVYRGYCAPNPGVGAIIVYNNEIISTGCHTAAGTPHAEIVALDKAGNKARGATIYITLEPCTHWGRTPPCTNALIEAGIKRVVYGYSDPNITVRGKGKEALLTAGIECDLLFSSEIKAFYLSYTHWCTTNLPFVTIKIALTLDGKIAGHLGKPLAITSQEINNLTHRYRKEADAILTTSRTITHDNPQLNARHEKEVIAKNIYILDRQLNLPLTAKIFLTAKKITIFHAKRVNLIKLQQLLDLGVSCHPVEEDQQGLQLDQVLRFIGNEGVHDLWVEVGATCFTALFQQNLWNRLLLFKAPWIAGGKGLSFHTEMEFRHCQIRWQQVGKDVLCDISC